MDEKKLAVAEGVKALLAEYADHELRVEQQLARKGLAENREQFHSRKQDTRRKIIIGGAVLAEAKSNPEFATELYTLLSRRVTDPRDWTLIVPPESEAGRWLSSYSTTTYRCKKWSMSRHLLPPRIIPA